MVRLHRTFPAVPAAAYAVRTEMADLARACGLDDGRVDDVRLAVSEAVTNAIIHAYRNSPRQAEGTITAEASTVDDELRIVIADNGSGMAPRADSPGLGMGLPLIASVALRVDLVSEGAGTEVHMAFPCPGPPSGRAHPTAAARSRRTRGAQRSRARSPAPERR